MDKIPNWACGNVVVKGKPKDIEKFCKFFIFKDEEGNKQERYFARSFVNEKWMDFKKNHLGNDEAEFSVDFAWSGYSCLIEGYPQDYKECVTLEWACKKYNVSVEITTEEGGIGFEEYIKANGKGVDYSSKEMETYECVCGNVQTIGSSYELEFEECCECGRIGRWGDELKEIIKEKIGNGKSKM